MKSRYLARVVFFLVAIIIGAGAAVFGGTQTSYDLNPPFKQHFTKAVMVKDSSGKTVTLYDPKNPYTIFINYELGMHCVGFDISYCCVIPPYNSIQAQAVRTGMGGECRSCFPPTTASALLFRAGQQLQRRKQDAVLAGARTSSATGRWISPATTWRTTSGPICSSTRTWKARCRRTGPRRSGSTWAGRSRSPLIRARREKACPAATLPMPGARAVTRSSPTRSSRR